MIRLRLVCSLCNRTLATFADADIPTDWAGDVRWTGCRRCYVPTPRRWWQATGDADVFPLGGRAPWSALRTVVEAARAGGRVGTQAVRIDTP